MENPFDNVQEREAERQLAIFREKLLDLSKRNRLLNYRHSPRNKDHIRIVDEVLESVYNEINSQKIYSFEPLPNPDQREMEPKDERNDLFQANLREARREDSYQKKLEKIYSQTGQEEGEEDFEAALNGLERELRDSIREQLEMPPLQKQPTQTNASWAKQNGINPKFNLPTPAEANRPEHHDRLVQSLLLPDEMEAKLKSIYRQKNESTREKGINTLFAAFGFIEWYEDDESDQPMYAPLVLVSIDMERDTVKGSYVYKIKSVGDDPIRNETLAVRLRQENLELPELEPDTPIDEYFSAVEHVISVKRRWKIRRYVTIGHFSFHRVAMYEDLNPDTCENDEKPFQQEIVKQLLGGRDNPPASGYRDVYNPDDDEFKDSPPLLIRDADSSQFSAVVDVLRGENLVIQGPPGTGKSQTISNIIAAAMYEGKSILFVAEKQSALEVVKKRLDDDGIGDFCLELHSVKASKAEFLNKIKHRLRLRRPSHSQSVSRKEALEDAKDKLKQYLEIMHEKVGDTEISVQDALWMARQKRHQDIDSRFRGFRFSYSPHWRPHTREELKSLLVDLVNAESALSDPPSTTPWSFIRKPDLAVSDFAQISDLLEMIRMKVVQVDEILKEITTEVQWNSPKEIRNVRELIKTIQQFPDTLENDVRLGYDWLSRSDNAVVFSEYKETKERLERLSEKLRERINLTNENGAHLLSLVKESFDNISEYKIPVITIGGLDKVKEKHFQNSESLRKLILLSERFCDSINIRRIDPDLRFVELINSLFSILDGFDKDILVRRSAEIVSAEGLSNIRKRRSEFDQLKRKIDRTKREIGVFGDVPPLRYIQLYKEALNKSGIFVFLNKDYRAARAFMSGLYRQDLKRPIIQIREDLKIVEELAIAENAFIESDEVQSLICEGDKNIDASLDFAEKTATEFYRVSEEIEKIKHLFMNYTEAARVCGCFMEFMKSGLADKVLALKALSDDAQVEFRKYKMLEHSLATTEHSVSLRDFQSREDKVVQVISNMMGNLMEEVGLAPDTDQRALVLLRDELQVWAKHQNDVGNIAKEIHEKFVLLPEDKRIPVLEKAFTPFQLIAGSTIDEALKHSLTTEGGSQRLEYLLQNIHYLDNVIKEQDALLEKLEVFTEGNLPDWLDGEIEGCLSTLNEIEEKKDELQSWGAWIRTFTMIRNSCGSEIQDLILNKYAAEELLEHFEFFLGQSLAEYCYIQYPQLRTFQGQVLSQARRRIRQIDEDLKSISKDEIYQKLYELGKATPLGNSIGGKLTYTELSLLRHQATLKRASMSVRRMIKQAGEALQCLTPCFMMSPLSVSQFVSKRSLEFDLVIFDEASQVLPQDAIGAMLRGKQFVVVGDNMQLPPTTFFSNADNYSGLELDEDEIEDLKASESILDKAESVFQPSRRLLWHYRSKDPSLIAFSNKEFYDNELQIFPAPHAIHPKLGVHYKWTDGKYVGRSNPIEADAVVNAAIIFMRENPNKSLGIATLNAVQRDLIDGKLDFAIARDRHAEKYRKTWSGTLEPLFVKNLETVQGDERDVMFISTVFGRSPNSDSPPAQRFGPINSEVGHRRLNVLFTRAKESVYLFTSLRPEDILVEGPSSWGRKVLRNYLEYARSGRLEVGDRAGRDPDSEFEVQVRDRLRANGYDADCQVGVSGYFIDLAVKHPLADNHYLLGVECDGARYHSFKSARDRDRLRQNVLEGLGWQIHRIWSTDWFNDPEREMQVLLKRIRELQATTVISSETREQDVSVKLDPATDEIVEGSEEENDEVIDFTSNGEIDEEDGDIEETSGSAVAKDIVVPQERDKTKERLGNALRYAQKFSEEDEPESPGNEEKIHKVIYPDPANSDVSLVSRYLLDVIRDDGPLIAEHAYHLYLNRADIGRLGRRIKSTLNKSMAYLLNSGKVELVGMEEEVFHRNTVKTPDQDDVVLRPMHERTISRIPKTEILELIRDIKKKYHYTNRGEIKRSILDFYGFVRLTQQTDVYLGEILDELESQQE